MFILVSILQSLGSLIEEEQVHQETATLPTFPESLSPAFLTVADVNTMENLSLGSSSSNLKVSPKLIRPVPIIPVPLSSKMADLNLNEKNPTKEHLPLSLKLSTPSSEE